MVLEGEWHIPFTVEPVEKSTRLTLDSASIPARSHDQETNGKESILQIQKIRVSATEIQFVQTAEDQMLYPDLVSLVLRDGTEVGTSGGGSRWTGAGAWSSVWYWSMPVDLSQAEALRFGNSVIPLC